MQSASRSLIARRHFSISRTPLTARHRCKVLVVGGGTGGCAIAAKLSRLLKQNELIVLEPSKHHYYQALYTLVGGGIAPLSRARKDEKDVLPKNCVWIKEKAAEFDLHSNIVRSDKDTRIEYDYLIVATGIIPRYEKIPGLVQALNNPKSGVCSIYSPKYVSNVFPTIEALEGGNALFTFPDSPVKCPGAPQKICYIAEDYLRKEGKRDKVTITYNTSLPVIFGVKKYADALWKVCEERDIRVNTRTNLTAIDPLKRQARFENLDRPEEKFAVQYAMLHVTPPMSTTEALRLNRDLTNEAGFVNVNKATLQHVKYSNVFAIGDCSSSPNSKTAAAAAAQTVVVFQNLQALMAGEPLSSIYDGYASCPLVTGYDRCILAEFDYDLNPLETFPFSQDKERLSMYLLKKNIIPKIYWKLMMNGYWNGPAVFRKLMHFGAGK